MNKSTRIVKKLLALFLVVLMSIESIAAVVGDNDGAAFITKAEFESLKNDFQSQINRYNSSLDDKISGAIASYLDGVKVAKKSKVRFIGYDEYNVHSVVGNETLEWVEGTMNLFGSFVISRMDDTLRGGTSGAWSHLPYTGFLEYHIAETPVTDLDAYKECGIKDIDSDEWTAVWDGYKESKYRMRIYASNAGNAGIGAGHITNLQACLWQHNGWEAISSTRADYRDMTVRDDKISHWANKDEIDESSTSYQNDLDWTMKMATVIRYPIKSTCSTIISTKTDNAMYSFVNYDGIYDWCNDTTTPPTETHSFSSVNDTKHIKEVRGFYAFTAKDDTDTTTAGKRPCYVGVTSNYPGVGPTGSFIGRSGLSQYDLITMTMRDPAVTRPDRYRWMPYVGFTKGYIDNWNEICSSKYDDYVKDMKECDANLNTLKNKNKDRLALTAGLPVCKVENMKALSLPLQFKDNEDHYVWIKTSSFKNNIDPQNDSDCIITFQEVLNNGVQDDTLINSSLRAIKVPAGKTITIKTDEMTKDSYIFIKWSLTNNSCAGGGEFITPYEVYVEG